MTVVACIKYHSLLLLTSFQVETFKFTVVSIKSRSFLKVAAIKSKVTFFCAKDLTSENNRGFLSFIENLKDNNNKILLKTSSLNSYRND